MELEPLGQVYDAKSPFGEDGKIAIDAWLDYLEIERRTLKMRLSQIEDILIEYKRLRDNTRRSQSG